jgi:predicted CXXCH cytochrome family protein
VLVGLTAIVEAVAAQGLGIANSSVGREGASTVFDEITDRKERVAFQRIWNDKRDPKRRLQSVLMFLELYPRSVVLRESYEIAAEASFAVKDYPDAMKWGQRALRIMPENAPLLLLVADLASRQRLLDLSESCARDALRCLAHAAAPASIAPDRWSQQRDELRGTAYFILGRVAALRASYASAEELLSTSLALHPRDAEAQYTLGLTRKALHRSADAAACFAEAIRLGGPLAGAATAELRLIYDALPVEGSRNFEQYAAALRWRPVAPTALTSRSAIRRYAGAASCHECHPNEFRSWQATGMAKMFRVYRAEDVMGDFSGNQVVEKYARLVSANGRASIEIRNGRGSWTRYPVDYLIGSKWQQAYAARSPNGEIRVLPIQFNRAKGWVNYWKTVDGDGSTRTDISRFDEKPDGTLYQTDCAPCHTSQLLYSDGPDKPLSASFDGGINCEMCHGPSADHVASQGKDNGPGGTPVDFKKISAEQSVAICAQCHMQSAVHEPAGGGAVNYTETGGSFVRTYSVHALSDFSRKAFYSDGRFRATTFIVESFTRSRCFRKGGATCASCHDPHPANAAINPTSLKFAPDSDEMCLQCHFDFRDTITAHSGHAAGNMGARCVSCHMPKITDAVMFSARSHQIDDIPDAGMTARFGPSDSPNACLICHRNESVSWLDDQLRAFRRRDVNRRPQQVANGRVAPSGDQHRDMSGLPVDVDAGRPLH